MAAPKKAFCIPHRIRRRVRLAEPPAELRVPLSVVLVPAAQGATQLAHCVGGAAPRDSKLHRELLGLHAGAQLCVERSGLLAHGGDDRRAVPRLLGAHLHAVLLELDDGSGERQQVGNLGGLVLSAEQRGALEREIVAEQVPVDAAGRVQRVEVHNAVQLLLGVVEELHEAGSAARPAAAAVTATTDTCWR